jgi:hypothetical protein
MDRASALRSIHRPVSFVLRLPRPASPRLRTAVAKTVPGEPQKPEGIERWMTAFC